MLEGELACFVLRKQFRVGSCREYGFSHQHLVENEAEREHVAYCSGIALRVVALVVYDLRGYVTGCSTSSKQLVAIGGVGRQSKVDYHDVGGSLALRHDVLGLQIPMDDPSRGQHIQPLKNIFHDSLGLAVAELPGLHFLVELLSLHQLTYHVDRIRGLEYSMGLEQSLIAELPHNVDFVDEGFLP